jgi:hypothetical protein
MLEELNVLLILDGLDELGQSQYQERALKEIAKLAIGLDNSILIVTSRTGDFVYNIDNTVQYELAPFTNHQISAFAQKWLNDKQAALLFLEKVYESPFADTTIRPLTLAHLCAIYERIGKIPDKPKTVYRKVINLLLEEWDQQRFIKRDSRYAQFEVDRKFEFLCHLAYTLTVSRQATTFSKYDLQEVYKLIYQDYDLLRDEAHQVVGEIESHTGLILQTGYERFEFAHKSLQEYLAAEHLVKLPAIPSTPSLLSLLANELAIAVTISSRPSDYFSELVSGRLLNSQISQYFIETFITRLLLEKPDFNSSTKLLLSFLLFYSHYLEIRLLGYSENTDFTDQLTNQFEETLKLILLKNPIDLFRDCYIVKPLYQMKNGNDIYRAIQRDDVKLPYFPVTFVIRKSILKYLDKW